MRVLLVSFDKVLVNKIKDTLQSDDVITVKNGEEAINTVFTGVDIVVYDAISGAISEADINRMYNSKFKDARYIILYDELFPIDPSNIEVPNKIIINREEVSKIIDAIMGEAVVQSEEAPSVEPLLGLYTEQEEIKETPQEETQEVSIESLLGIQEVQIPQEVATTQASIYQFAESGKEKTKVMVITFDDDLLNKIKFSVGDTYEIFVARNRKEIFDMVKDVDLVVFDTISGNMAQRILMDLSKDEEASKRPYVILVDELFAIDTDAIPLPYKYSYARESEFSMAMEKVRELSTQLMEKGFLKAEEVPLPLETSTMETLFEAEEFPSEEVSEELEKEPTNIDEILGLLISKGTAEEEMSIEAVSQMPTEKLEPNYMEEKLQEDKTTLMRDIKASFENEVQQILPNVIESALKELFERLDIHGVIRDEVQRRLSKVDIVGIVQQILPNVIESAIKDLFERLDIRDVIRDEVQRHLSEVDIVDIIRQETVKVLRERLQELIT